MTHSRKRLTYVKMEFRRKKVRKCDRNELKEENLEKDTDTQIQEALPCGWEKFITNDIISKLLKTRNQKKSNRT